MADIKIVDETFEIARKRGNGKLRREVWVDNATGKVTRYNLAYVNYTVFNDDNGRVIGFDNAHDSHHMHKMGKVTPVKFTSFEDIELMFEREWMALRKRT